MQLGVLGLLWLVEQGHLLQEVQVHHVPVGLVLHELVVLGLRELEGLERL